MDIFRTFNEAYLENQLVFIAISKIVIIFQLLRQDLIKNECKTKSEQNLKFFQLLIKNLIKVLT